LIIVNRPAEPRADFPCNGGPRHAGLPRQGNGQGRAAPTSPSHLFLVPFVPVLLRSVHCFSDTFQRTGKIHNDPPLDESSPVDIISEKLARPRSSPNHRESKGLADCIKSCSTTRPCRLPACVPGDMSSTGPPQAARRRAGPP